MKNILFILPDQMRWDFLGCYGADFAKTPNLDALAQHGVLFERCISPSPLCVPARASLLTGENSLTNGVLHNGAWLRPDHADCGLKTWPQLLSDNGYETIAVGKMHFYPWDLMEGFDKRIIAEDKRHVAVNDDYAVALAKHGLKKYHGNEIKGYQETKGAITNPLPKEFQVDNWIANQACDYLQSVDSNKPFAMMIGFPSPHCPYDPDQADIDLFAANDMPPARSASKESEPFYPMMRGSNILPWCDIDYDGFTTEQKQIIRQHYSALIHQLDCCVGQLIDTLKEQGLYDDTVIVFSSDHGDFVGDYNMVGKHLFFEPSIHVPLIIHDQEIKESKRYPETVCLTDIRATLLHIAGVADCETTDSKVLPCYKKTTEPRYVFGMTNIGTMVTTDTWKLCHYNNGQVHLFNMEQDPEEIHNLANDTAYATIKRELADVMQACIINSAVKANSEKTVKTNVPEFNARDWARPYPV